MSDTVARMEPRERAQEAEGDVMFLLLLLAMECTILVDPDDAGDAVLAVPSKVQRARESLAETDRIIEASADALLAIGCAVAACPLSPSTSHLWQRLVQVEARVRDVVIWRCQMSVPIGDRDGLEQKLREAFNTALADNDLYSQLMHAYHKEVATRFLSDTDYGRSNRIRRRKLRERNRKQNASQSC